MRLLTPILLLSALFGCQKPVEEPPQSIEPQSVENAALGISLAEIAAGFEVVTNEGSRLELEPTETEGRIWFELGPVTEGGVNLVEIVNSQKDQFLALPDGTFSGNRELLMTDGRSAYYSRGQFSDAGKAVEELRISALHPTQNRLLRVLYRYPQADDSSDRLTDLLLIVGEIEPYELTPESPEAIE